MKKVVLFFGLLIMATITFAQAPQAFNYQAVIRDADGNLLENQAVGIKISLLQGTSTGQEVYAETHATTTNPYGLVDLQIGTGTATTGQFDTIAWGAGPYYLQLAVDLTGGANYAVMGTTQMLSVPYALYAEEGSGWEKTENGITYLNGKVGIGTEAPLSNLQITGASFESFTGEERGALAISAPYEADYFTTIDFLYAPWSKPTARIAATHSGSGSKLLFGTSNHFDSGITNTAMTIDQTGRVSINKFQSGSYDGSYATVTSSQGTVHKGGLLLTNTSTTSGYRFKWSTSYCNTPVTVALKLSVVDGNDLESDIATPLYIRGVSGFVGINTENPTFPLTVNGTIRSKKVIVDTGWSDFVFEDDYKLMPLHEVEAFIKTNRHLPEIPSAGEVEENGVSLGEISASLLQKIEELTLYVIDLKKENEQQQQLIEEQGKQIKKLEKRRNRR
jgi:hypothetical protein